MEEDILTQDEDTIEEEMKSEEEVQPKKSKKKVPETPTEVQETYEGFRQDARLGIVNTLTGEVIDGFDVKRDEGLIKLGKAILNQLNKISIATGA